MSNLRITGLTKTFGSVVALDDLSVTAAEGELLTLLGPSGCGKSTTLWSIAGLHTPDSGRIEAGPVTFFDGVRINLQPEQRNCGVVFQSYAIWPHMRVRDNIGYPLKLRRVGAKARATRIAEVLELVEMTAYADRYPHQLSGGQQQRVALARALAFPPQLLLLDEPFSNLDAKLRERARTWVRELQQRVGVTTVFVTHDQDEALSMSDRVVVMNAGKLRQAGTPEQIYHQPADRFVAEFVGTTNLLDGAARHESSACVIQIDGLDRPLIAADPPPRPGPCTALVRPEDILIAREGIETSPNTFDVVVTKRAFLGDHYHYTVRCGAVDLVLQTRGKLIGDVIRIVIPPSAIRLLPAEDITTPNTEEALADVATH